MSGLGSVRIARALERGQNAGVARTLLSQVWKQFAEPTRSLVIPKEVITVGIGGATLGGSGKTPLAIAVANQLASAGRRTVLVGHGVGATLARAEVVSPMSDVALVGDEAIICARALPNVAVIVGPSRAQAIALAMTREPEVMVLDGILQARPTRFSLSLLAMSEGAPWGAGSCPPAGDLRASISRLKDACDHEVMVGSGGGGKGSGESLQLTRRIHSFRSAQTGERVLTAAFVARHPRVNVATSIARPERLIQSLEALHLQLEQRIEGRDHHRLPPLPESALPWIMTEKCFLQRPSSFAAEIWIAEEMLTLSPRLLATLSHLFVSETVRRS